MFEIHHFGDDLCALNRMWKDLEFKGFKCEREVADDIDGQNKIDEIKQTLLQTGFDVVICKTRGLMTIWSKKTEKVDDIG